MIYLNCSAFVDKNNNFQVRSIYITSMESSWVLTEGMDWEPQEYYLNLATMKAILLKQKYTSSQLVYSQIRVLDAEDAESFANFLKDKLRKSENPEFYKKLYLTLSEGVGEEYKW